MKRRVLLTSMIIGITVGASAGYAAGLAPSQTDARLIMNTVFKEPEGNRAIGRMQMTIKANGGYVQDRVLRTRTIGFDEGKRRLMIVESPADVRNTGVLIMDFEDGNKTDDQWLYVPSLRRSMRISAGEKSGAFMGSDFTFSDLTKTDPSEYDFDLVQPEVAVDGEPCWLIEARPRTEREKQETGYLKLHVWINKQKRLVVQTKAWVRNGQKLKYIKAADIRRVDGIWTPYLTTARTVRGEKVESETTLKVLETKYNDPQVTDTEFSLRRLEQGL